MTLKSARRIRARRTSGSSERPSRGCRTGAPDSSCARTRLARPAMPRRWGAPAARRGRASRVRRSQAGLATALERAAATFGLVLLLDELESSRPYAEDDGLRWPRRDGLKWLHL